MFIVISIFIFGLIIAIHEFGHLISAKLFGVGVPEFAIGMGPKVLKFQGKETLYTLRLIPFGGFCALEGDDTEETGEKSLFSKPLWQRMIIFLSGSMFNILSAFLVLLLLHGMMSTLPTREISGFADEFPLQHEEAFQVGDQFHRIGDFRVFQNNNIGFLLDLQSSKEGIDVEIIRDGQRLTLYNLPLERRVFEEDSPPRFGFFLVVNEDPTFFDRLALTTNVTFDFVRQLPLTLRMFMEGQAGAEDVSSVIGIVDIMNQAGQTADTVSLAATRLAFLAAIISISVATINLLPLPALDGGRIFLMLVSAVYEKIFKRPPNPKVESYINTAGFVLLLSFMIFIMFQDIVRIIAR